MCSRYLVLTALLALASALPARADFIPNVSVSSFNLTLEKGHLDNLLEEDVEGTHLRAGETNAWLATFEEPGYLLFDLKQNYTLASISVWNLNGPGDFNFTRGVNSVGILIAADGGPFTLLSSPTQFEQGANNAPESEGKYSLGSELARYVRINILSSYSPPEGGSTFVGLSGVAFDGTPAGSPSAVPAPPTLWMALAGAGLTGVFAWRRRYAAGPDSNRSRIGCGVPQGKWTGG